MKTKTLRSPLMPQLEHASADKASKILSNSEIKFEDIGTVNWPADFPNKPEAKFKIARSSDNLFIYFSIVEECARAEYINDNDPVWQDSCVEFFCKLPEQYFYRNFEFNCIGSCLATAREGRNINIRPLKKEQLSQIERFASLGNQTFKEKIGLTSWSLCIKIPFILLNIDPENIPEKLLANFYKCADGSSKLHYLSWNPIETETPDFHRPDFFGEIIF